MASVISLGIHKPAALTFLVAEGILPPNATEDLLRWQTVNGHGNEIDEEEEEIATTDRCVIWSRGSVIQRVFRFEVEGERVTQAIFTCFPSEPSSAIKTDRSPRQLDDALTKNGLNIRKSREPTPKVATTAPDDGPSHVKIDLNLSPDRELPNRKNAQRDRALVIVLRTQAHVFFLAGTSYTVHLPFEVEKVYPLYQGLLLQRKVSTIPKQGSKHLISLSPPSTNGHGHHSSSKGVSSTQEPRSPEISRATDSYLSSLPLFNDFLRPASKPAEVKLPRLYCLTDPLSEMGIVVTGQAHMSTYSLNNQSYNKYYSDLFDPNEDLLYVSSDEEFGPQEPTALTTPNVLAVTQNSDTGLLTIWLAGYVDRETYNYPHKPRVSTGNRLQSRRRSSYGPGVATGASTPVARVAAGGRDSLGNMVSRGQPLKDPTLEENLAGTDGDLVSQLDPAFGNSSFPAKSSRRVSSLLARADLSSSRDQSTFTDIASGSAAFNGSRRGASFGAYGMRVTSVLERGTIKTYSKSFSGLNPGLDPLASSGSSFEEDLDEFDLMADSVCADKPGSGDAVRGLRKEMIFTGIYAIPHKDYEASSLTTGQKGYKIFTLKTPDHSLEDKPEDRNVVMCLLNRKTNVLLVLRISLQHQALKGSSRDPSRMITDRPRRGGNKYQAHVVETTKYADTIDACKIRDGDYSRILLISKSADGGNELSLQAPWSTVFKIQFPSTLLLNNPFNLENGDSSSGRREGSLKRILSRGPQYLIALENADNHGKVDIIDNETRRHRIRIQLKPYSPYVHRMIRIVESVLPYTDREKESILQGWWDVMSWLRVHDNTVNDIEWASVVIVLFFTAVESAVDEPDAAARQKKRKGGLLRSSSGANTDLESWETMLKEESRFSISPPWMKDAAWSWILQRETTPTNIPLTKSSKPLGSSTKSASSGFTANKTSQLIEFLSLTRDYHRSHVSLDTGEQSAYLANALSRSSTSRGHALAAVLLGLHLLREEYKLDVLAISALHKLTPILAQIGNWLGWESWGSRIGSYYMLESAGMKSWLFDTSTIHNLILPVEPFAPPSILHSIETAYLVGNHMSFVTLPDIVRLPADLPRARSESEASVRRLMDLTPQTIVITKMLGSYLQGSAEVVVEEIASMGYDITALEKLPESVAVAFRAAISSCQSQPVTTWDTKILGLIGRYDIGKLLPTLPGVIYPVNPVVVPVNEATVDFRTICSSTLEIETVGAYDGSAEEDRQEITRLIFKDDQRFAEAAKLVHPLHAPIARCVPELDWSDTELLEAQQELVKIIAMRTLSVSVGRGLLFYCARVPLPTEKFPIHGFTLGCVMKPTNTTVTADRNAYTEEKVSWAFFHAGVEAGLSIAKNAKGVDASWILFNKPYELKNRHAGFILALGLNGHLKSIARWVAFKYLTPKHTMTSIGLLLGLSASYIGTMDTLLTRLLSVHVTRMLPPGAAELNISPLTQTSGIMGMGLLYFNTQHRRMSEIMLSEMESVDHGDNSCPLDSLRDEGYRLAAGFALGYINLGHGKDLKGLHDMHIVQRLLALAVGTRRVNIVHVLDKATAAATIAIALIFMKTHDLALARKIDIPDTIHQFDYVRPDVFLLRTVARHLIMWDYIHFTSEWMERQLPAVYRSKLKLNTIRILNSEDMPLINIIAGLCLSIGLRFAGTGHFQVRSLLCQYLDQFMRICRLPASNYDGKLARISTRNCQDVVALAAACVMAGTGDLLILRRLRSLHGRTDADTPYGSHLAAHLAIGILFLGGGTHTFNTSNLAVASLLCTFYPLFPNSVLDNKSHLQAFRHFWVLAVEPRCLVTRDADSDHPVSLAVRVTFRTGEEVLMTAPCLLPDLATVATIQTDDSEYWRVTLQLSDNPAHFRAFQTHQSIYVRRRAAYDAHASVFSATMQALIDRQSIHQVNQQAFLWIFTLPSFALYNRAERALVLPTDATSAVYNTLRGTVVDDRLVLETGCIASSKSERLWNLRILFAWADGLSRRGNTWHWFGKEIVESLRAALRMKLKLNDSDT